MESDEIRVFNFSDESIQSCFRFYWNKTIELNATFNVISNANEFHKRAHSLLGRGSRIAVLHDYTL